MRHVSMMALFAAPDLKTLARSSTGFNVLTASAAQ